MNFGAKPPVSCHDVVLADQDATNDLQPQRRSASRSSKKSEFNELDAELNVVLEGEVFDTLTAKFFQSSPMKTQSPNGNKVGQMTNFMQPPDSQRGPMTNFMQDVRS